ncbi:MAG: VWA domain-containing protein [Bryobacterales bacterium]|nr:VWA domain-containing protein [Bryobacterales bacterium]
MSAAFSNRKRRGFVIIFTALTLVFIVPMIGLAIDAGILYAVRARLSLATDAAALGAARSLSVGQTLAEQEANATSRAIRYFDANFPNGTFDTTGKAVTVAVAESAYRTRTVTVNAEVTVPAYFMRIAGWGTPGKELKVRVVGQASRRDVNVVLVLDRSGSLANAGACDDVEAASIAFVNMFANGRDRVGLVSFGGSSRVDYSPTMNFKDNPSLPSLLSQLDPGGCVGATGSAQALWNGYQQLVNINEPGALNVVVYFTDGQPTALTADWPVRTLGTTKSRCYDWDNNKSYSTAGWNPVNQKYRGYISNTMSNLRSATADTFPEDGVDATVTNPLGYLGLTPKSSSSDCRFRSTPGDVDIDVAYIPDTDAYGNSVFGIQNITLNSGGSYPGKPAMTSTNIENAAINVVDNAAQRMRQNVLSPNINTVIYCIGLGGVGEADATLMRRIANDPDSPIFDVNLPQGMYVYAPTAAQLNQAFLRIASEVLRFSL